MDLFLVLKLTVALYFANRHESVAIQHQGDVT